MDSIKTEIDIERNLAIRTVTGSVSGEEILNHIIEYYSGDRIMKFTIWDCSNTNMESLSNKLLQEIAHVSKSYAAVRKQGKTAIVAPEDFSFALGRQYEVLTEIAMHPIKIRTFHTIAEAEKWLFEADE